ncbi:hypothetical protein LTR53_005915 [Teratosphaeriaceae sp. CCFEE 6253]|nr:hypothetical protein LTR53_005915 [Teratosphaeriaceae sp. CCFEE 6253]
MDSPLATTPPAANVPSSVPVSAVATSQPASHCDRYPDTDRVAVILKTGATEALDKIPTQLVTSLHCVREPLLFSDLEQRLGSHTIHDVLANVSSEVMDLNTDFDIYRTQHALAASGRETELRSLNSLPIADGNWRTSGKSAAWGLDKYKFLHMIELAWRLQPDRDWYVFLEGDSYLSWRNLLDFLASHDAGELWYFGEPVRMYEHPSLLYFAHGGAGFILSGAVVREWKRGACGTCEQMGRSPLDEELHVQITDATPVMQSDKPFMVPFGEDSWCKPVVTLHYLDSRRLDNVYRTEQALERSPLLFKNLHAAVYAAGYPFKHDNWDNGADALEYAIEVVPNENTRGQWEPKDLVDPHANELSCELACIQNNACFQFSFTIVTNITNLETTTACHLSRVFRLGEERKPENSSDGKPLITAWTSGWRSDRISKWIAEHQRSKLQCDTINVSAIGLNFNGVFVVSSSKRLLTIFGATGNQGGSVLDVYFAHPDLQEKYALRGITRDPSSPKSQTLVSHGVEMVKAELNDAESLDTAIAGSYGVFGVTDFWSVMSKDIEIQQGKNIFEACRKAGVKHLVFSTLPCAEKVSGGKLTHVDHFDGKSIVADYIEAGKGEMLASYFMPEHLVLILPAMFLNFAKTQIKPHPETGVPTLAMPFPSDSIPWPLIDPRADGGKYVMGLFEGGAEANGVSAHAVSTWTTPKQLVADLGKVVGREVVFKAITGEEWAKDLKPPLHDELLETMLLVGDYSYYGVGAEKKQADSDRWLIPGATKTNFEEWAKVHRPWGF